MKVEQYIPEIEDNVLIPERAAAYCNRKFVGGELIRKVKS